MPTTLNPRPDWATIPVPRPRCDINPSGIHRDRDGQCSYCQGWSALWLIQHDESMAHVVAAAR